MSKLTRERSEGEVVEVGVGVGMGECFPDVGCLRDVC